MTLAPSIANREFDKFKESSSTAGQTGVVTVNPDGSDIGSSGITAITPTTASASLTSLAISASSQLMLAANTSRGGVIVHNNSSETMYVKFGATATASIGGYTYAVAANSTLTLPEPGQDIYTGVIHAIWSGTTGSGASITEL